MNNIKKKTAIQKYNIIGMRTIKTILAVILSSLFMKYILKDIPFFACIGAVVAVERTVDSSFKLSIIRNVGTVTGGVIGILISSFTENILLISLGLIPLFFVNNKLQKQESNVPASIVYFAVSYLNTMDQAWIYGVRRILGTLMGSLIGLAINMLICPPPKKLEHLNTKN